MAAPNVSLDELVPQEKRPPTFKRKKWSPKKWEPQFEEWVLRSVRGESNASIAKHYGYTPQHVSVILNSATARLLRRQILESLQKSLELRTEERLANIQDKALTRITQVLDKEGLVESSPLALVDRCVTVLRGTGVLRPDNNPGVTAKNAVFISPESASLVAAGLRAAEEARRLNAPVNIDVTRSK